MALEFRFTKITNPALLTEEIQNSEIIVALNSVVQEGPDVIITFKADLSLAEEQLLTDIVNAHTPIDKDPPDSVVLASPSTPEDGIPYIYSTTIPLGWFVAFQGAGDDINLPGQQGQGQGEKIIFHLTSRDESLTKDFVFNEDVYVKDGYMISKQAPFGSSLDIDVVHPVYGPIMSFGKKIPIFGSGWFPLNTDGRAFLPKGMILRITVYNSNGGTGIANAPDEQPPADFWLAGRFEIYRKKP